MWQRKGFCGRYHPDFPATAPELQRQTQSQNTTSRQRFVLGGAIGGKVVVENSVQII